MSPHQERTQPLLDAEVFQAVVDGVRLGRYHLVLGAGASAGCRNSAGQLPMARELESILLAEAGLPTGEDRVGLQRSYDVAQAHLGAQGLLDLLRHRYAGATPQPWHLLIPKLRWPCIWTLNIDDVAEAAYAACTDRVQTHDTVLWRERPRPLDGLTDAVPIVHLHGYVGGALGIDPQLVFSLSEYLSALQLAQRSTWQTTFRSYFPAYPVIIIGASLADEVDFAEIIRQGNTASLYGLPSLVILPTISELQRLEFTRWGLVPLACSGETFLQHLIEGVEQRSHDRADDALYYSLYTDRTLHLFREPGLAATPPDIPVHDFYGGHEPDWQDILHELDAVPRWVTKLATELGTPETVPKVQLLYVLCGAAFTGKSTGLLRLARELQKMGWEPVALIGWERLEVDEVVKFLADRPRAILFVDPLWFDAHELDRLLRRAQHVDQRLLVIGVDRIRHLKRIKNVVSIRFLVGAITPIVEFDITDGFWWAIVRKRHLHARLGRLEGANERRAKLYFVDHERDLYSALASLEDASGFVDRGIAVFTSLPHDVQSAFAVIALIGAVGLPSPVSAVASVAGVGVMRLMSELGPDGSLSDWVALEPHSAGVVKLRHGYFGEILLSGRLGLSNSLSFSELSMGVCLALAGSVSAAAIKRGTLEYRIVAELMDERLVKRLAGDEEVDSWYAALEESYRWNARFWEQRALAQVANLDRAYSFARRAVELRRDAFALTTLGTVLMRRVVSVAVHETIAAAEPYWREAVDALAEAREDDHGRLEPPFTTFFSYTGKLFDGPVKPTGLWVTTIRQAFEDWLGAAKATGVLSDPAVAQLLHRFPEDWFRKQ